MRCVYENVSLLFTLWRHYNRHHHVAMIVDRLLLVFVWNILCRSLLCSILNYFCNQRVIFVNLVPVISDLHLTRVCLMSLGNRPANFTLFR